MQEGLIGLRHACRYQPQTPEQPRFDGFTQPVAVGLQCRDDAVLIGKLHQHQSQLLQVPVNRLRLSAKGVEATVIEISRDLVRVHLL